jgi:hypothetical protein
MRTVSPTDADHEARGNGARTTSAPPDEELARLRADLLLAEETIDDLLEHLDGLGRLEEELQAELGQLQMDHREALTELNVANVIALGAIEEARQADLGQMQIDRREALAAAEERHRAVLEEQHAAHVVHVVELEAAHAEALGDVRRATEARICAAEQERDATLAALEDATRRAAEADARCAARERDLTEEHARAIIALEQARAEEEGLWRARLDEVRDASDRADRDRAQAHDHAEAARAEEAAAHAEALTDEHRRELSALAADHTQAITAERFAFEQLLAALQDELAANERRLAEARTAYERERDEMLSDHAAQIATLEARAAEVSAELSHERAERSRLEAVAQPRPSLAAPGSWTGRRSGPPRVHASLGDALLAAAAEQDDDE